MSRRATSRRARQERKKTLRVLIGLGLTTSAFAAVAGTIAWTWVPQIGNWTLSPQQDFAEYAKDSGSRGRAWVPPEMPAVSPWDKFKPTETAGLTEPQSEESTTQVASVEAKDNNSSGHGPMNYDQNENENGNFFGLFSPGNNNGQNNNGGGGSGGSWSGTFNPNGGGGGGSGFQGYSQGPGGPGTGGPNNPPKSFSSNPPPGGDGNTPPGGDGKTPPTGDSTTPPTGDGTTPPTGDGTTPPTGDGTTPPTGDGTTPPTGDGTTPPTGDGTTPPTGDGTTPPTGDGTTPPTGDGTTPPTGDDPTGPGDHPQSIVRLEETTAIPEPGMLALLASGLLGLGMTIRRHAKR